MITKFIKLQPVEYVQIDDLDVRFTDLESVLGILQYTSAEHPTLIPVYDALLRKLLEYDVVKQDGVRLYRSDGFSWFLEKVYA